MTALLPARMQMMLTRRFIGLLMLLLLQAAHQAAAQGDKTIRLVVGNAPGGVNDSVARSLAAELTKVLGQRVVVENVPGASGQSAIDTVSETKANDEVILLAGPEALVPGARDKVKPAAAVGGVPTVLVARPNKTLSTLKSGGKVTVHASVGLYSELLAEQLQLSGSKPDSAKPSIPVMQVLDGTVDAAVVPYPTAKLEISKGQLMVLAANGGGNLPALSYASKLSLPKVGADSALLGLYVPMNTPQDRIEALGIATRKALQNKDVQKKFEDIGITPRSSSTNEFRNDVQVQYSIVADACKKKTTCEAYQQCPRPCP